MKLTIFIAILALLTFFTGCNNDSSSDEMSDESISGLRVSAIPARVGDIQQTIHYSGIIRGYREVAIAPGMSSWVVEILVKEGDSVRKGQKLAKLSPETFDQAQAQFHAAEESYFRMKALYEQESISKQQFDQIEAGYKAAKAGHDLAEKNTVLRAPFAGVVASVDIEAGNYFNAMMSMGSGIMKVIDLSKAKIELNVSEKDVVKIRKKQETLIDTDSYPDRTFIGAVDRVDRIANPMSGTYKVTIIIPNNDRELRSGMYAKTNIIVASIDSTIIVSQEALVNDTLIYIADGNTARTRKVSLGVQSDSLAQVIEGVEAGEPVIVEGILGMFDGAPIIVKKR